MLVRIWAFTISGSDIVRASSVFIPEFSDLTEQAQEYMFGYSILMLLKPGGFFVHGMSVDSCQLYQRHWIIKSNDNAVGDFNGEAVIGQKEFVYECCITSTTSAGAIEGSYTFIPGRLADPQGSPFEVKVARFPLVLPEYIF
ncbi:putative ApaG domain-containing protein [Helianthus anomalus]